MTVRAEFQKNYLTRYLILSGVCLFMAAWFAYDGLVGYPQQMVYAEAYDPLREMEAAERAERWQAVTAENNWPRDVPKKTAEEIGSDITGQYVWAILNLMIGLPVLILFFRARGSWVEATPEGLTTSWGQTVRFADVTRLDKRRWQRKGIAKALYNETGAVPSGVGSSGTGPSGGGKRVFTFDDFKFQREPLGVMLRDLEASLQPEQIVGGPPEEPPPPPAAAESEKIVV